MITRGYSQSPTSVQNALLAWYDGAARRLPWRALPGVAADPYRVWLSEIMLQQTTVKAVIPYFQKFLALWPDVQSLAAADIDAVMAAWAGLGYYSRARNLHACAKAVAEGQGGRFPSSEAALAALPGIGTYTAAAIAAIAFAQPATVVDGNVERVVSRLFAIEERLPAAKPAIRRAAATLTPQHRPGDFAQAMMDLGAGLCSPRAPSCGSCPLVASCTGYARGIAASLPARQPKAEKPQRYGAAFVAVCADGAVLLRRRPPKGLLGGMMEVPGTEWGAAALEANATLHLAPARCKWRLLAGSVTHTFTHFHLELAVYRADRVSKSAAAKVRGEWVPRRAFNDAALPSVMRKVLTHALRYDPEFD